MLAPKTLTSLSQPVRPQIRFCCANYQTLHASTAAISKRKEIIEAGENSKAINSAELVNLITDIAF